MEFVLNPETICGILTQSLTCEAACQLGFSSVIVIGGSMWVLCAFPCECRSGQFVTIAGILTWESFFYLYFMILFLTYKFFESMNSGKLCSLNI